MEVRKLTATLNLGGSAMSDLGRFGLAVDGARSALNLLVGGFRIAKEILVDFTLDTAKRGDEINDFAKRARISAEAFQELSHAAKMTGASSEAVGKGINTLAKNIGAARRTGTGPFVDQLKAMNLSLRDFDGMSPDQAFERIADVIGTIPDDMDRMAFAQEAFGRSGRELLPLLDEGSKGIRAYREEAQTLGIMSNEQVAASDELIDAQAKLDMAFGATKDAIAGELIPVAREIVDGVRVWITENRELVATRVREFLHDATEAGRQLAPVVRDIATAASEAIPKIVEAAEEFGIFAKQARDLDSDLASSFEHWGTLKQVVTESVLPFQSLATVIGSVGAELDSLSAGAKRSLLAINPLLAAIDAITPDDTPTTGVRGMGSAESQVQVHKGKGTAAGTAAQVERMRALRSMVAATDAPDGLRAIAVDLSIPAAVRKEAVQKLDRMAKTDAASVASMLAKNAAAYTMDLNDQIASDFEARRTRAEGRAARRGKGGGRRAASEAAPVDEALSDADLIKLVNQAAQSGQSLTGLIGDRKVPGGVPPVITVTINKFEQDVDISASVVVNGVPGTSAEEVASVAVNQFRSELGKAIADAKEDLAPVQAI